MPRTLYDKLWDLHEVTQREDGTYLLYIDRHLIHEVTSPQAFEGLRLAGRKPWRTSSNKATPDHNIPTTDRQLGLKGIKDEVSKLQVTTLDDNCKEHGIEQFDIEDERQGIVHVVGPEQGITLPGMTVVCGDSHTSTHGALGSLAMGIGTALVVTIYLLLNALYLYALPVSTLATVETRVIDATAGQLFGSAVAAPLAIASAAMIAASVSAMVLAGPRVYYAMAQNGQFFSAMARIHPRYRTPAIAIIAQSLWAGVLVLTGTFEQLIEYTGFAVVLFAGFAVSAVFVLRHRHPNAHRPFKAWGYPVAPLVFVSGSFMMVVNAIFRSPVTSLVGLAIIAAGVPVYFAVWKKSTLRKS